MKYFKLATFLGYIVLIWLAIGFPLTVRAQFAQGTLALLAAVHLVECYLFRRLMRDAPGPFGWHLLNVFLFGYFHMTEMKEALHAAESSPSRDD